MFWLIWITIIVLVPVGVGVQVWWNLHRTSRTEATAPQLAQPPGQIATSSTRGTRPH
jgi:hypothetical protein